MTEDAFIEFLVAEIDDDNLDFVTALLAAARTKITRGGGEIGSLLTGSLNGKSFTKEMKMDAAVVAMCCRAAIDLAAGEARQATQFDFSGTCGI